MDFIKNNKGLVGGIAGAVLLLSVGGFLLLNRNPVPEEANLITNSSASSNLVLDPKLLSALTQLKLVKLDLTLFQSPIFKSLEDFSVEIEPQPFGRSNPFAPLGDIEDIDLGEF